MSFSSGTFSINTSGQPVVTDTIISASVFNALTADLATGLSTCMLKDGTQTITANIPMATYKFTGLGAGSGAGDSLRYEQLFTSGLVTLLGTLKAPTTISVGAATPANSGSGVTFPATDSPSTDANTLDDYQEVDFTLSISDGSGAGLTFSDVAAYATKIGNRVMFSITVTYPATADVNNSQINGLPFSVSGDVCLSVGDNSGASLQAYAGAVAAGAISITGGGTFTRKTNADLSGKKIYVSGNYKV